MKVKVSVMRKVASTSPCDVWLEPRTECVAEVHASRTWPDTTLTPEDKIDDIACVDEATRRHSSDPADAGCQHVETSPFKEGCAPEGRDRDLVPGDSRLPQNSESAYHGANREAFNEEVGTARLPVCSNAADVNGGVAGKVKHLRGLERDNRRLKNGVMMLRLEVELLRQIVQHASRAAAGDKVYLLHPLFLSQSLRGPHAFHAFLYDVVATVVLYTQVLTGVLMRFQVILRRILM